MERESVEHGRGRRRIALIAIGVVCFAWAFGGEILSVAAGVPESPVLDFLGGYGFVVAGLVAAALRPGNRIGTLLVLYGVLWFCGNWANVPVPAVTTVMLLGGGIAPVVLMQLALSFPTGRIATVFGRVVIGSAYVVAGFVTLGSAVTWDPRLADDCDGCAERLVLLPDATVFDALGTVTLGAQLALTLLTAAAFWERSRRATPLERRDLRPMWLAIGLVGGIYLVEAGAAAANAPFEVMLLIAQLRAVLQLFLPGIVLYGLLTARVARGAVGAFVERLAVPLAPGQLQEAVRAVLDDPRARIAYAIDTDRWVDVDGAAIEIPGGDDRSVTVISTRDGGVHAAIAHDPGVDADLVHSVAAASALAIQNEALFAEVNARLAEVRASRARIVAATDAERTRIERNLHDGAQQRLMTLALTLSAGLRLHEAGDPEATPTLRRAIDELREAVADLRDLARGIHPAILTDAGLGPAIRALADRCALDVDVRAVPTDRPALAVEATAYYVVAEGLANAVRHSGATRAWVSVSAVNGWLDVEVGDAGSGGARPDAGSGLRGLHDRISAASGSFEIDSPPGRGTVLRARIPLAPR